MQVNRLSGSAIIVLSLTALLAVVSGYFQPPQPDEGAAAHIFQLSIVALVPAVLIFVATADWKQPLRTVRCLALPAVALVLAFGPCIILNTSGRRCPTSRRYPSNDSAAKSSYSLSGHCVRLMLDWRPASGASRFTSAPATGPGDATVP